MQTSVLHQSPGSGLGAPASSLPDSCHHPGVVDSGNWWPISIAQRRRRLSSCHGLWLASGTRRQLLQRKSKPWAPVGSASQWGGRSCHASLGVLKGLCCCGCAICQSLWPRELQGMLFSVPEENTISPVISIWKLNFSSLPIVIFLLSLFLRKDSCTFTPLWEWATDILVAFILLARARSQTADENNALKV